MSSSFWQAENIYNEEETDNTPASELEAWRSSQQEPLRPSPALPSSAHLQYKAVVGRQVQGGQAATARYSAGVGGSLFYFTFWLISNQKSSSMEGKMDHKRVLKRKCPQKNSFKLCSNSWSLFRHSYSANFRFIRYRNEMRPNGDTS